MNAGDLAHLVISRDSAGSLNLAMEGDDAVIFYVESSDGQKAVIRYTDDEVEITVPVADLIPVA